MPTPLPDRCRPDSVREFRTAASHRYRDGRAAADAGRPLAAVYLWGYAAEMLVKAAFFRATGNTDTQPITHADLVAAQGLAPSLGVVWVPKSLHNVAAWGQLLVRTRAVAAGAAYPGAVAGGVLTCTQNVYDVWRETLRYHANTPHPFEVAKVRAAVEWLLAHARTL